MVSAGTTIAVRPGGIIDPEALSEDLFQVTGELSGSHTGQVVLASDRQTIIFRPDHPFKPGERVNIVYTGARHPGEAELAGGITYSFTISPKEITTGQDGTELSALLKDYLGEEGVDREEPDSISHYPDYRTVPDDFPRVSILISTEEAGEGYLFLTLLPWGASQEPHNPYLVILDNEGEPVFYKRMTALGTVYDFKKQPDGRLTFYDNTRKGFIILDESYQEVGSFFAGNGYTADVHDLQILPNGNALLMIYDPQPVDMSKIVPNGNPNATVVGLVIQELDPSNNVVFEWRSWDHFEITDTSVALAVPRVDYVHGNAVELDHDGNLLLSSRNLCEVTKINRQTGEVIWRMGGKKNEFTFLNDDGFFFQHDIRRQANGNITLFDNRAEQLPVFSRAIEYKIDEVQKTVELVWSHSNSPTTYSRVMGNAQRLPNGNTLIGWGSGYPTLTEVTPDGGFAFELALSKPYLTYRAFRFPWEGLPLWKPDLVVEASAMHKTLYFSWNGATNTSAYKVFAGNEPNALTEVGQVTKTGFETVYTVDDPQDQYAYFQVVPVDTQGNPGPSSEVVTASNTPLLRSYFPIIANP